MICPGCGKNQIEPGQARCPTCWDKTLKRQRDDEQIRRNFPAKFTPRLPYTTRRPGHVKH